MMKKMKLADVPFGKNFEVWGHAYTVLDNDDKGVLVLETNAVCEMPFQENGVECKVAPNNFRGSPIRWHLSKTYLKELVSEGAYLGKDICRMELSLKCTLGQREYGVAKVYAGLLTLEQYGKYYDIIPKIDTTCWLATPWKTPRCSPDTDSSNYVWRVSSDGDCGYWYYGVTYGVHPTLTLSPSLLVSVECDEDEEEEVESKWHKYLEYMIRWAISHSDKSFVGCCPVGYAEWINSNREDV